MLRSIISASTDHPFQTYIYHQDYLNQEYS